ncbi:hypothetical protein FHW58_001120 [Duganella sp. 1224]|uniref:hypothetical protein n=1 Tax=Duganella sp. 1224 TaxID=2587052 RepID=UPI0015CB6478|nr:hypothetical protein [Duganella sp. 1224]NYE59968.1 hypothetical protein [Duganella sp. 1224]
MGLLSFISSAASSVVSAVSSVASAVYDGAKSVVREAISFIANKGEGLIATVKETWGKVKPYLQKISPFLQGIAKLAPYPWLKGAILAVDKGLTALLALENSPILKKLERAAQWVIKLAQRLDRKLSAMEEAEAREHQQTFDEAKAHTQGGKHAGTFDVAAMLNELALVKAGIANLIDEGQTVTDMEHYLRLRATQKLMRTVEDKLSVAASLEHITADDIFLVKVGASLLSDAPQLSEVDAERLDGIVLQRFGTKLTPFVFEEMHKMWQLDLTEDERQWKRMVTVLNTAKAKLKNLQFQAKVTQLSAADQATLDHLAAELPEQMQANEDLMKRNLERENYISATEGFLQLLEKSPEELRASGQEYLLTQGKAVGEVLIACAQHGTRWHQLSPEQQALIGDFANIFREASIKRGEALVVECNG